MCASVASSLKNFPIYRPGSMSKPSSSAPIPRQCHALEYWSICGKLSLLNSSQRCISPVDTKSLCSGTHTYSQLGLEHTVAVSVPPEPNCICLCSTSVITYENGILNLRLLGRDMENLRMAQCSSEPRSLFALASLPLSQSFF